jgi:hypothetical protein
MRSSSRHLRCVGLLVAALAGPAAMAQTSPAHGALQNFDAMPLADYLGLLHQIAPAAEEGAKAYLAAFQQRCGRAMRTAELRRSMAEGDGDPVLMGLIRASQLGDAAAREQWVRQLRCPGREAR